MPIFEYKCEYCKTKFEVLHKSQNNENENEITCPQCNSRENKKLFSAFSASVSGSSTYTSDGCSDGSCGISDPSGSGGGCSSGFCGLN